MGWVIDHVGQTYFDPTQPIHQNIDPCRPLVTHTNLHLCNPMGYKKTLTLILANCIECQATKISQVPN